MIDLNRIHEVHGSELVAFRNCRLQHKWSFEDGYSMPVTPAPLEFGSAFHIGMEAFWNPETWHLPIKELYIIGRDAFVTECNRQKTEFLARVDQYVLDPEMSTDYDDRIELGKGMLRKFIRTLDRRKYTPVLVEQEAFVPVEDFMGNRMFCKCADCVRKITFPPKEDSSTLIEYGLPVHYGIRVDAVLRDQEGGYWIVDWKSASQLMKDQTVLELDGQVGSYCWALMHILNLDIRGFKYVQIRKEYPKLPRPLAVSRNCRRYSTNKQQLTDYQTFRNYVHKHDSEAYEAGWYDEYLSWLKKNGPTFVQWSTVYKTPAQLESIGRDVTMQIMDLLGPHRVYPSWGHLKCRQCPFQEPCLERQSGGDYEAVLKEQYVWSQPYYVLARERRRTVESS
jgi:PD-(D/E)XK nuclease superfamily